MKWKMSKKDVIKLFIIFFVIIYFSFNVRSIAIEHDDHLICTVQQKAIQEVANAYYRKGSTIQYESTRRDYFKSPEEATADNIVSTTCHAFAYQVYWQAFGIEIPKACDQALEYCRINKDSKYVVGHYTQKEYLDLMDNSDLNNHDYIVTDEEFNVFSSTIISKLEIGDILTEKGSDNNGVINNHTMLVESFVYNENNQKIDAILIESSPWDGGLLNENEDKLEPRGSILKISFKSRFKKSYKYVNPSEKRHIKEFSILRPISSDYEWMEISPEDLRKSRKENFTEITRIEKEYDLTSATISRLKYPGIDIYKVGSKHTNSIVGLGEEITYTIKITNNSDSDYEDIPIVEFISEYVDIVENSINYNGIYNQDNNSIQWILNVVKGETQEIVYKVKVKEDQEYLNTTLISEGKVDNIKSATIINKIGNVLNEEQKEKIVNKVQEIKSTSLSKGIDFINEVYKEGLNVNKAIELNKIGDLLNNNAELENIKMKKMVLNDLYATFEATFNIKNSNPWIWGTATEEVNEQKGKAIVTGNLNIGDVILVEENNLDKAYIYLGNSIIGLNEDNVEEYTSNNTLSSEVYNVTDEINVFLANLSSKSKFIILSPILTIDLNLIKFHDYIPIIENEKNYLVNIDPNTTVSELLSKIETNGIIQILKNDTDVMNYEMKLLTGIKIKIFLNNESKEYVIAVKGDTNGDGECDIKDLLQVNKHRLNKIQLENEYKFAGDLNNDNKVDIRDLLQINKYRRGKKFV